MSSRTPHEIVMRHLIAAVLALALSGCANYSAVSEFARQTTQMTAAVSAEFAQLDALCVRQAELSIAILDIDEASASSPLKSCESYRVSQGRLAEVTVQTLDAYARTLLALADNKPFNLAPDIKATTAKLTALKTPDGAKLVNAVQVDALSQVLVLLTDISTQTRREETIRRLVAQKPNVVINAQLMRSFFARAEGAPAGPKTPYENLVGLSSDSLLSYVRILRSDAVREAEPIRAREIDLSLKPTRKMLAERQPAGVPATLVKAIDAWILAADTFETEAMRPDAPQLIARLKDLREKTADARDAVRALN